MVATVSRPVRILALAGLLLAAAGGGSMLLLNRSQPETSPPPAPAPTVARPARAAAPKAPATIARPAAPASAHAKAAAPATAHAKAAPARRAHRGNLVDPRLPTPLQWQLSQHRVVVVALYDPHADVDAITVAEAHAGAVDAHAGFLLVSVLDNAVAGPLTALLPGGGLLPDPGVLVYRAPGTVAFRLDGFHDRAAIAQAAANAEAGQSDPTTATAGTAS